MPFKRDKSIPCKSLIKSSMFRLGDFELEECLIFEAKFEDK